MRAFIAIDLPEDVRSAIYAALAPYRASGGRVSWVPPERMHLTLKFLGDVDEARLTALGDALDAACGSVDSFWLRIGAAGAFPSLRKPAILWAGVEPAPDALVRVHEIVETSAEGLNFERDPKKFHPHVTVARIRRRVTGDVAREAVKTLSALTLPAWDAGELCMYSSELTREGPIYRVEKKVAIGGNR